MYSNEMRTIIDISRCGQVAALLECSAHPKPGNVHRLKDFPSTRYEHFLIGASILGKSLEGIAEVGTKLRDNNQNHSEIQIGRFILEAVEDTSRWQTGGNINLGIILLLLPLAATAGILLKDGFDDLESFRSTLSEFILNTTPEDALNLYEGMRIARPGGMGQVETLDLNDDRSFEKIREDNLNIHDIFLTCASRDSIAREWTTSFEITFDLTHPYLVKRIREVMDINTAIVDTYLYILSEVPDTLIQRKAGKDAALKVSQKARELLSGGGLKTQPDQVREFDTFLQEKSGLLNPGTTADLVAAGLMIALLRGLRI